MLKSFIKNNLSVFLIIALIVAVAFSGEFGKPQKAAAQPSCNAGMTIDTISGQGPISPSTGFTILWRVTSATPGPIGQTASASYVIKDQHDVTVDSGSSLGNYNPSFPNNGSIDDITYTNSAGITQDTTYYLTVTLTTSDQCPGGTTNYQNATLTVTAPSCSINYFTKLSHEGFNSYTIGWSVSGAGSVDISPGIGAGLPAAGTASGVSPGVLYTLTAGSCTSSLLFPGDPTLDAKWTENNSTTINVTATPGTPITLPFNFSNVGEKGSVIRVTDCTPSVPSGTGISATRPFCDAILTAP